MENSEVNDYLDTLDETVEGSVDESVNSLLGEDVEVSDQESEDFVSAEFEEALTPQAPIVSMETLPITGEARVDDALGRLADLQGLPVHEHVDVFEDVQRRLHETLADLAGQ
jgi:hypothetical protein